MTPFMSARHLLWYIDIAMLTALLFRFIQLRVYRRYPTLTLFFVNDFVAFLVGMVLVSSSNAYYWMYFVSQVVGGAVLLRFVATELFGELYSRYPGLYGATQHVLKRSILISFLVTLLMAPVALIHWGEPDFNCWELPFVELRRCVDFGFTVFVVLMWNMLGVLPLEIRSYVKTYSWSMCWYLGCCGLLDTVVLIAHRPIVKFECDLVLLAGNITFYGFLALRARRPSERQLPTYCPLPIDTVTQLKAVSSFFEQVAAAHDRGRPLVFRRASLLAIKPQFHEPPQRIPIWWHGLGLWDDLIQRVGWFIRALWE